MCARAPVLELPGILNPVVNEARDRREAIRQLADLRRRLEAAERALTDALAASKRAEEAFDAASDRFDAAERALDEAREDRARARRDRYAARQAYERASATADRLARRVRETSERLDRTAELAATLQCGSVPAAVGDGLDVSWKSSAACALPTMIDGPARLSGRSGPGAYPESEVAATRTRQD